MEADHDTVNNYRQLQSLSQKSTKFAACTYKPLSSPCILISADNLDQIGVWN